MISDPIHNPLRDLFRRAWMTTGGDVEGARQVFGMFIRMSPQSLTDFHHLIEDYAVNRLVEEMRAADAEKARTASPRQPDSVCEALRTAADAEEEKEEMITALMPDGLDAEGRARVRPLVGYLVDYGDGELTGDLNRLRDVGLIEEEVWPETGLD